MCVRVCVCMCVHACVYWVRPSGLHFLFLKHLHAPLDSVKIVHFFGTADCGKHDPFGFRFLILFLELCTTSHFTVFMFGTETHVSSPSCRSVQDSKLFCLIGALRSEACGSVCWRMPTRVRRGSSWSLQAAPRLWAVLAARRCAHSDRARRSCSLGQLYCGRK